MTTASHAPIVLVCHPSTGCGAVRALHVTVGALEGRITLGYELSAELDALRIPAQAVPQRADGLWRHTCFEAFLAEKGAPGYCELNFAPSRAWALYRFSAPRDGMRVINSRGPEIAVHRHATGLTLTATLDLQDLIPARPSLRLRMGLAAVVEDEDGRLSYWAVRHSPGKPDFHDPDSFTLELAL